MRHRIRRPLEGISTPASETQPTEWDDYSCALDEEPQAQALQFRADAQAEDGRLDRFLARVLPTVSRSQIQQWIELGAVEVDGAVRASKHRLNGGEWVSVRPQPRVADTAFCADPVALAVVHIDPSLIVIDKPAGLVTHPAAGHWRGTLMNGLLHHWPSQAALPRAGIVHRLDKDTSGLLVVARTESAVFALGSQLAERTMSRRYLALVDGVPPQQGTIQASIGRDPHAPIRMAVVEAQRGRPATTHFTQLGRGTDALGAPVSLLECRLETGRTHQIRVHLQHLGYPLVGDPVYGRRRNDSRLARQALHAWKLGLWHPTEGSRCEWQAGLPADFQTLLNQCAIAFDPLSQAAP